MAHNAEKHAPCLFGSAGAFKGFFKFRHVFRGPFILDHENMEEAVADKTAESGERRERQDDLKS